ncbi:MAG: AgmX/PglI C-terminal domain-containing protein, partial [Anaeromyxobacteraceae bacterium]
APAPARAQAQAPRAADRPKHERLAIADKELLDLLAKKGDVAVTVQADETAALATTRGTLDSTAIEGTLSRNSSSFAACVSRAASSGPDQRLAANRVNLELTIRPSGRVQKVAVADKAVAGTPLGLCIAQAAKRMVFPGFDGEPIDIVVPLKLRVGF